MASRYDCSSAPRFCEDIYGFRTFHPSSVGWGCGAGQRAKTLSATLDE